MPTQPVVVPDEPALAAWPEAAFLPQSGAMRRAMARKIVNAKRPGASRAPTPFRASGN
jgi:hypothetical protein